MLIYGSFSLSAWDIIVAVAFYTNFAAQFTEGNSDKPRCSTYRLPCDFFDDFDLFEAPLRSIVTGIGDAYPCSASAKNTTVFTRSAATAAEYSATGGSSGDGGGGIHGGWVNLPLSRLSRYSAACNRAAILMFDDDVGRRAEVTGRRRSHHGRERLSRGHAKAVVGNAEIRAIRYRKSSGTGTNATIYRCRTTHVTLA